MAFRSVHSIDSAEQETVNAIKLLSRHTNDNKEDTLKRGHIYLTTALNVIMQYGELDLGRDLIALSAREFRNLAKMETDDPKSKKQKSDIADLVENLTPNIAEARTKDDASSLMLEFVASAAKLGLDFYLTAVPISPEQTLRT